MKIGVSLYSFHGYSSADSLGIKGCIDKVKEFGGEGVDFVETAKYAEDHEGYLAYAKDIGDYCKEVGIQAVCFCVGSDFLNRDTDAEIERVKKLVDVAAAYGCLAMRHDATPGYHGGNKWKSFDTVLSLGLLEAADKLRLQDKKEEASEENTDIAPELLNYINEKIEARRAAKAAKNFAEADAIRQELLSRGITLVDTREGTKFTIA